MDCGIQNLTVGKSRKREFGHFQATDLLMNTICGNQLLNSEVRVGSCLSVQRSSISLDFSLPRRWILPPHQLRAMRSQIAPRWACCLQRELYRDALQCPGWRLPVQDQYRGP